MDIRWQQRFNNYKKVLNKLADVVNKMQFDSLTELEKEGLIKRFEYTFELAWKTLQDLLKAKGYMDIAGPNATLTQAFADGYISDAEGWRKMKKSRELTSHVYDDETAKSIACDIVSIFYNLLASLVVRLEKEINNSQLNLFDE
ncbi:MAG: nucleotidyltransferase [Bacteroidetes bacterium RIFOXYB2_FULL_35_7]|nr:MAG: nucleotidyltransferase [Bacteroidetes bacterium GWF2_35_48]OFY93673.1 MAG: nucleotidyltransferase [Bacteroidetes bacterium RIFOXYC12_FULL_35_7]OFY96387.1 MAG: nucleotidyltransferase [Bacteroidetes bacterium RIFOXYB2_FULL_35_7]HBX50260.1 nucleotidyltransferase [Bacteroidales bacterium]